MGMTKILSKHTPIYHLMFFVPDVKKAALLHNEMFGSGPYVVIESVKMDSQLYLGKYPMPTDVAMATGWWGNLAVEFVQQNNSGHTYYKDNYGKYGFHHICIGVGPKVQEVVEEFKEYGCEVLMTDFSREHFPYAYIDARELLGMFIEINPGPDPSTICIEKWAKDWDGKTDLLRTYDDVLKEMKK